MVGQGILSEVSTPAKGEHHDLPGRVLSVLWGLLLIEVGYFFYTSDKELLFITYNIGNSRNPLESLYCFLLRKQLNQFCWA